MHLVNELVLGILKVDERRSVSGRHPRPSTRPAVSLGRDILGCRACRAHTVDSRLVEVEHEGLIHIVVLVVGVEDDEGVVLELCRDVLPPGFEARGVGDDGMVEAAVVVGLDHGVGAFGGDVVDLFGEVAEVVFVEGAGEGVGSETLHYCGRGQNSCMDACEGKGTSTYGS